MSEISQFKGLRELNTALRALPPKMAAGPMKHGVGAAARFIRDIVRDTAPIADRPIFRKGRITPQGTLRRAAIAKFIAEASNNNQVEFIVTFKTGKRSARLTSKDAFYARFVEFGHKSRNGGQVAGKPSLGPALARNIDAAVAIMGKTIEADLALLPEFRK